MPRPLASVLAAALLCALAVAGCASSDEAPDRPPRDTAATLDAALEEYRALALPEPAPDEALVSFGGTGLGFARASPRGATGAAVLVGTERRPAAELRPLEPVADPERLETTHFAGGFPDLGWFEADATLPLAIQCHARGWTRLGLALYRGVVLADQSVEESVRRLAWSHLYRSLASPGTDRARVHERMRALLERGPELRDGDHERFVELLARAAVPSKTPPGSPEALVDGLVDACGEEGALTLRADREVDPHIAAVLRAGLAAVPALIAHLDDDRPTRQVMVGFNNFGTFLRPLGGVATDILVAYAGDEAAGSDWVRRQQGWPAERAKVEAWWAATEGRSEEEVLVARLVPGKNGEAPPPLLLAAIEARLPARLADAYLTGLRRTGHDTWDLAERVARSALPPERKREVLLAAAAQPELADRGAGLQFLAEADPPVAIDRLVADLAALPTQTSEPYWKAPESFYAHVVLRTANPRAWKALVAATKRASVGLRMELMNPMNSAYLGGALRLERLTFLAAFLDDAEVRDKAADPWRFEGPCAAYTIPRLEVRDLAAAKIASILDIPHEGASLAPLRERVRAALAKEGISPP